MANIASQIKRNRQNEKKRLRNRNYRGAARTAVKVAFSAMTDGQDTSASVLAAISALDRAAQKGAIHHRNAARRKGRLLKRLAALQASGQVTPSPKTAITEKPRPETAAMRAEKPKAAEKKPVAKAAEKKPAAKKSAPKKTTKK